MRLDARRWQRMCRLRWIVVMGLFASGCAGSSSPAETVAEPPVCRSGAGAPITEGALKDALATEGIRMYRDDACFANVLVALTNIPDAVSSEREDELLESQGHISCEIHARSAFARIHRYVWRNDRDPTYVEVLNVDCAIYPETKRQTDRLERALRRLAGVSNLPSTVPSADAMHD
jgi:hypothetical protein